MNQLDNFDPNGVGLSSANIFGLPFDENNAEVIIIPVPWEVTVSYRTGTALGPEGIFNESYQVDLFDPDGIDHWKKGYYMLPVNEELHSKSNALRKDAEQLINALSEGININEDSELFNLQNNINKASTEMIKWVYDTAQSYIQKGKKVALIGGDHSTPLGIIKAIAEYHGNIGILQIDAHADLRNAYEGFKYSHASIMYNVLNEIPQVSKLVQVGIRDYCDEELDIIKNDDKVTTFFDRDIKIRQYEGETWKTIVNDIVSTLPQLVYISFDADGLDPKLCPNTGTPVPGGYEMDQVFYLFNKIKESGRKIVGFDVNEVSAGVEENMNSIDFIVGARLLYKLCNHLVNNS